LTRGLTSKEVNVIADGRAVRLATVSLTIDSRLSCGRW